MMESNVKKCPRCNVAKAFGEFHKRLNGLGSYCKSCCLAYKRKDRISHVERRALIFPEAGMKRCSKCDEVKALTDFNVRRGRPDGEVRPDCRGCQSGVFRSWAVKEGRQTGRSREEALEAHRAEIYVTPETKVCTKCRAEKPRSEFTKFGDKLKHECKACKSAINVARYATRKEAEALKRAAWKAANLEKAREYARRGQHRRRAAKAGVENTLTAEEWQEILVSYGGRCLRCETTEGITMDHVTPITKGGGHTADNVQPLCGPCNSSKGTKIIDYRPARIAQ